MYTILYIYTYMDIKGLILNGKGRWVKISKKEISSKER